MSLSSSIARSTRHGWVDLISTTRPRVMVLVLLTAPPVLVLGDATWPGWAPVVGILLGVGALSGGASAMNAWWERDLDAAMARTRSRPLPAGRVTPRAVLLFGLFLSVVGLGLIGASGGWLAGCLGALTWVHYVGVYTLLLKRLTPQNIVIGGMAGAAPPLIVDAVDGVVGLYGVALWLLITLWTPPHFWAIALYRSHEYEAAGIPMMPNVAGPVRTRRTMLLYGVATAVVSLVPWWAGGCTPIYGLTALGLGVWFCARLTAAMRTRSAGEDRRVFLASVIYLSVLFAVLGVDAFLFAP
jgi:heme o synthase